MSKQLGHLITPGQAKAIRAWREKRGMSIQDVIAGEGSFGERTLRNYEQSDPPQKSRRRISNLRKLAAFFGVTFDELLDGPEAILAGPIKSFQAALNIAETIDKKILRNVRDLTSSEDDVVDVYRPYRDSLVKGFSDGPGEALHFLEGSEMSEAMVRSRPTPDLIVKLADDFKSIVYESPSTSITVKNPELLWDCPCNSPDSGTKPSFCPIHKNKEAEDISSRFSTGIVEIQLQGAKFLWRNSKEFWPPSVDSIFFLKKLRKWGVLSSGAKSVLDIGAGTGFLGTMIAREMKSISQVGMSDWLFTPILFSQLNWTRSKPARFISLRVFTDMFTCGIAEAGKRYDLVVCNPPYLPIHKAGTGLSWESTTAGTDLLRHVIGHGHEVGKRVFVQFSDLASKEVEQAERDFGKKVKRLGDTHLVPFRVRAAFQEAGYLEYLLDDRGLKRMPESRHPYSHRVGVYEIVNA